MMKHAHLLAGALILSVARVAAQAGSAADCTPTKPVRPRGTVAPEGTTGEAGGSLSDQLAKSNGVLCPLAGGDPEMRAPTPDAGNTPAIPPPGSPGGNPKVQPK